MNQTDIHFDPSEDRWIFHTYADCEANLELNKALRSQSVKSDGLHEVADVPTILILKWLNEENARGANYKWSDPEFRRLCRKKLDDPEWAFLRTDGPRHQIGYQK